MAKKNIAHLVRAAALSVAALSVVACTGQGPGVKDDEDLVGEKLDVITMGGTSGAQNSGQIIALFDETVRKVHIFDVTAMTHLRALPVVNPGEAHYVLAPPSGNYVIDFTLKGLVVYPLSGAPQVNPVRPVGLPKSAALDPKTGTLVVYDSVMNVSLLKISDLGVVSQARVLGPKVDGATIAAGDLADGGRLVVILSDASLAVIDVDQSIAREKWIVVSRVTPGIAGVNWVAAIKGTDQVLLRSESAVILYDLSSQSRLAEWATGSAKAEKLSRQSDPHVVLREKDTLTVVYPDGGVLKSTTLTRQSRPVLSSVLDLKNRLWSTIDTANVMAFLDNDPDAARETRTLRRRSLRDDEQALINKDLPAGAQLRLAQDSVFALFPNKLGYAVRYNINDEGTATLKLFNMGSL